MLDRFKAWARDLQTEAYALYLACRDPRTPWYAKALAALVVAHTFSPIDLIPDFIPILGYLDDLIITPGGLWLARRLVPPQVMDECRQQARRQMNTARPLGRIGLAITLAVWLALAALAAWIIYGALVKG